MRTLALCFLLALAVSSCAGFRGAATPAALNAGVPPLSLRAEAVVAFEKGSGEDVSGRAIIVVKAPDRFRIEVLGPFSQVVATLISDGSTLYIFSNGKQERHSWKAPGLPFSFTAEELVSFLTGAVPNQWAASRASSDDAYYRTVPDGSGRAVEFKRLRRSMTVLTVRLSDFREVSKTVLPFSITIDDGSRRLRIRYKKVEVNPQVNDGVFSLD